MKNFNDLNHPETFAQMPVVKFKYWTKERCKLLTKTLYILDDDELRAQFDGYSIGAIKNKAAELRLAGWDFVQARIHTAYPKVGPGSLWRTKDEEFMMSNLHLPRYHLAELMNRSVGAIAARINKIKRTQAYIDLEEAREAQAIIEAERQAREAQAIIDAENHIENEIEKLANRG